MTHREKDGGREAGATNQDGVRESVRGREREGGGRVRQMERVWKGGAEFPKGRTKEGEAAGGRGDYLQQSKQDKLSVCISVWSVPITLFYPPGLYVDLLVGRWTRYFGVIYSHVTAVRGAVKLQNATAHV